MRDGAAAALLIPGCAGLRALWNRRASADSVCSEQGVIHDPTHAAQTPPGAVPRWDALCSSKQLQH